MRSGIISKGFGLVCVWVVPVGDSSLAGTLVVVFSRYGGKEDKRLLPVEGGQV